MPASAGAKTLIGSGSSVAQPYLQALFAGYHRVNPSIQFLYTADGGNAGVKDVQAGRSQFAAQSRPPLPSDAGTTYVKLFLDGIKQAADLSKTGMQVFELVYHEMRANPGTDEIKLNQYMAKDHGLSDRTYQRGVRELLEKEFLYRSPSDGVFFVNIRFMFNGDRLAFVRTYHLKGASQQAELPLEPAPSVSAASSP